MFVSPDQPSKLVLVVLLLTNFHDMNKYITPALLLLILVGVGWNLIPKDEFNVGSVAVSNEYNATTTGEVSDFSDVHLLKGGHGSLGSVIITGAAAGDILFYDATTSDIDLRTGNLSTTSITRVHIPQSAAAGTYTFDSVFTNGVLMVVSATQPTSTITFR